MEKVTLVFIGAREFHGKRVYGYIDIKDSNNTPMYFNRRLGQVVYSIGCLIESEKEDKQFTKSTVTGEFLNSSHPLFNELIHFSLEEKAANLKLEAVKNATKKQLFNSYEPHLDKILSELKYLDRGKRKLVVQHLIGKLYEIL